jgi:hypothetical protein
MRRVRQWLLWAVWMCVLAGMLPGAGLALEDQHEITVSDPRAAAISPANPSEILQGHQFIAWHSVFTFSAGVRRDNLRWSIAGNRDGSNPNILSELEWSSVDSYQFQFSNRTLWEDRVYLRAEVGYAWINDGQVRDSDYSEDNRSGEYSRSISDSDGDQQWDILLGAGLPFFMADRQLMVAPLLGVSVHKQNLRIRNGKQVLSRPGGPTLGSLQGLDSTYHARWFSPFVGCDLRYFFTSPGFAYARMEAALGLQWHWNARFKADADWNLRSDFEHPRSFTQNAEGQGVSVNAEWMIRFTPQCALNLSASYQKWETDSGLQRYYLAGGNTAVTRLNGVEWESSRFMIGIAYIFD